MSFDAIIVGSGACGGWAALELAKAGMKVLMLEAGSHIDQKDFHHTFLYQMAYRGRGEPGMLHHLYVTNGNTIPHWVEITAYTAIALGTALGGWRIVHTMGSRITKLRPVGGFCAETGGALSILLATQFGIPVSTTHTITGSIVGVGATQRLSAVRWGVAGRIVWGWVLTIPAAALMSAVFWLLLSRVATVGGL